MYLNNHDPPCCLTLILLRDLLKFEMYVIEYINLQVCDQYLFVSYVRNPL